MSGYTDNTDRAPRRPRLRHRVPAEADHARRAAAQGARGARERRAASVTQVVAAVPAGVLHEILLVVVLGARERASRHDLGDDRVLPLARLVDARLDRLGRLALLLRVKKIAERYCVPTSFSWRFSVVGSCMRKNHFSSRSAYESFFGIEHDAHRLGVAGAAGRDVFVARVTWCCRRRSRPRSRARRGSCAGYPPCPRSSRPPGTRSRARRAGVPAAGRSARRADAARTAPGSRRSPRPRACRPG